METKELSDIILNCVKGHANRVAGEDYMRTLDNYYNLAPDAPSSRKTTYLRNIQDTLVSLHDIQVEGILNTRFVNVVNYSQKVLAIGSLLTLAIPINAYLGVLGLSCLAPFIGITIAKFRTKKQTCLKDLQTVADGLTPVRDELKKVELKDLDYVLQQNKVEIMPYLQKAI
ncbi:MAG: hypothetical protein WC852_01710 [Candidatus Nanoarchaeia archaeon]|jgi:hypothetical protein